MKKKNIYKANRRGFTLVELIVVLVILAVLAAILLPALLGWIDKAKEKKHLLEARNVVMATQSEATTDYASGKFGSTVNYDAKFLTEHESEILKIADASPGGDILDLDFSSRDSKTIAIVQKLIYVVDGITITYDITDSPVYQFGNEEGAPAYAKNQLITIKEKLGNLPNNKINTTEIQKLWDELYGKNYPTLTTTEKKLLSPNIDGIKNISDGDIQNLKWRAVAYGKGTDARTDIVLVASSTSAGTTGPLAYYNGNYYACLGTNWDGTEVRLVSNLVNENLSSTDFSNAPSIEDYKDPNKLASVKKDDKIWVKLS